jgi:hypothetical protein
METQPNDVRVAPVSGYYWRLATGLLAYLRLAGLTGLRAASLVDASR